MTALAQIFAEIDTRLTALAEDREGSYERMPSGDPDLYPAINAFDDGDEPIEQETGSTRLGLEITIEGYMKGYGGAATHDAMLQLHADVVKALCGDAAMNLEGLVETIEIVGRRRTAVATLSKVERLGFSQDFLITFATVRGDPNQFA